MKILWLVNIIMPELAQHLGRKPSVFGGWLTGAMQAVRGAGHQLVICTTGQEDLGRYETGGVTYYICSADMQSMKQILEAEQPDVVHIYGTEFAQSWAMSQAADPTKTLVTIQGAMACLKDVVYAEIPERICRDNLLHRFLRLVHRGGESMELQKRSFEKRAVTEQQVLTRAKYINGGSEWGNSVARTLHPGCEPLSCGLILRDEFYTGVRWSLEKCEKHSIYILFSYPIKGFHKFLEAFRVIVARYPDAKAYVVGSVLPIRQYRGLKRIVMNTAQDYNWYVQQRIEDYGLWEHIRFLGTLDASVVKAQMLRSHVFVSASAMENQSTSLGEAMMLGVPSVASSVGAIPEMIDDGADGFLYPFDDTRLLADRILRIFEDDALAQRISVGGHLHAARTYDRKENARRLLEMYDTIVTNAMEAGK